MLNSGSYDFMLAKKVDRLRKTYFETLPQLHQSAYDNGILKMAKPCYEDRSIPIRQWVHKTPLTVQEVGKQKLCMLNNGVDLIEAFKCSRPWQLLAQETGTLFNNRRKIEKLEIYSASGITTYHLSFGT